jgi:putative hydrolase of the HAD superfamily
MIKAVIFDLDDTLYDYSKCNSIAENRLFETIELDFGISQNQASALLMQAKENVKAKLGDKSASSHNRLLYMQNICEQIGRNPLKYAMRFYNAYWDSMLEQMQLYDYVLPLLEELHRKNIKVGILTDLTAHIQYRKIERLGLTDRIDYLVTSEEAGDEKPSEKMFLLMLEKMKIKPEEALMIGDSRKKDIDGAFTAGIKGILYKKSDSEDMDKLCLQYID